MGLLNLYLSASQNNSLPFFNNPNDPTSYPSTTTGTPTPTANPGASAQQYSLTYAPAYTYLDSLNNSPGQLTNTLNITNLDTTDPGVDGGVPYKQNEDPTIYPPTANHSTDIRGYFSEPSEPSKKFNQSFNSTDTYLNFIKSYI
jgi:hypothetical protein